MSACDSVTAYCLAGDQRPVAAFWLRFPEQRDDLIRKVKASCDALINRRPGGSVMHAGTNSVYDPSRLQIHAYDVHQSWRPVIILEWRRAPNSPFNNREYEGREVVKLINLLGKNSVSEMLDSSIWKDSAALRPRAN
jgi:hypothetical protein